MKTRTAPRAPRPLRPARLLLIIYMLLAPLFALAQTGRVKGGVSDPVLSRGIDSARVVLLRPDGSVVDSTRAEYVVQMRRGSGRGYTYIYPEVAKNEPAEFSFSGIAEGRYRLQISKKGFDTLEQDIEVKYSGRERSYDCGDLWLYRPSRNVGTATVTGTRLKFVYRGDTLVYNAAAIQTSDGDMLGHLIEKLPGARIDESGNIYVNGRKIESLLFIIMPTTAT